MNYLKRIICLFKGHNEIQLPYGRKIYGSKDFWVKVNDVEVICCKRCNKLLKMTFLEGK